MDPTNKTIRTTPREVPHRSPSPVALNRLVALSTVPILLLLACTPLTTNLEPAQLLTTPQMSPDAVVFETAIINVDGEPTAEERAFWRSADELRVPTVARRALAEAGIRCGVIGSHLPDWAKNRLAEQQKKVDLEEENGTAVLSNIPTQQRLQCRSHQTRVIPLSEAVDRLRVSATTEGEDAVTYEHAQCGMSLSCEALGDGRVQVALTPQILHGPPRQRWVGENGDFRIDAGSDCEKFSEQVIALELSPGQTAVVSSVLPAKSLGAALFGPSSPEASQRKILLVRLAQTQFDDLFSQLEASTPIATTAE